MDKTVKKENTAQGGQTMQGVQFEELQSRLAQAEALYEQAPCGLFTLDAELRFVRVNQTLLNWLGYDREDMLGKMSVIDLVEMSWRDLAINRLGSLRQRASNEPMELPITRRDGSHFHALLSSTASQEDAGHAAESHFTVVDISERRAAEDRLAAHGGFLQTITDRIPARLAYYDKDLICRFANSAHANRYGKLAGEMVGSHLSQVVRPELLPEILPRVASALSGESQSFEAERTASDGSRNFYQIHYIPDFQNGVVEGIFIELHDISERRRTEEFVLEANRDLEERVNERSAELFRSEQRYRLMVDAIQDYCVYFVDDAGIVTEWSESAQRMHGHSRMQIIGQPYTHLLSSDGTGEDEIDPEQVLRLAKAHGQWETRGWRLREDGSRFWAHTVLTALRNEAGESQGLSSITRDMTAAKSLEDVMNDLNQELEKRVAERTQQLVAANKDLDVFSHMVSHDLRAPLRHISSFVSLLQEQLGTTADVLALQYMNSIAKASKRMSLMIEGLLEYARLGRVTLDAQLVPLGPLLQGVITHLQQENQDRAIDWVIEPDLPLVKGDAMLLAQACGNLLSNSVKYTRPRGVAKITVGAQTHSMNERVFFVRDNGVGFDLEKAHNLFVMFQRQHHSMDFEGTGTGLALAQRIIERHGGRIWAETSPDQGCTFFFTLPVEESVNAPMIPDSIMAALH
jgi:PAS domain S-box-containing protein